MNLAVYDRINSVVHYSIPGYQVSSLLILLSTSGVDILSS